MELNCDWRSFQSLFFPKKKLSATSTQSPVYLITEGQVVISVFADGQDLADWTGATYDEVEAEFSHREIYAYDRVQVDQWMSQAVDQGHFYDQVQFLRGQCQPARVLKNRGRSYDLSQQSHFLLRSLQTWWRVVLPSRYGIYICLDQNPATSIFLQVHQGRMDGFQVPDLSSMIPERRRVPSDVVKYISEHYLVPVQGMYLTSKEWAEWAESENPWPQIAAALKADRTKLAPFNWSIAALILLRGYFGI